MSSYTCQIDSIGPFEIGSYSWAPQHAPISTTPVQAQTSDVVVTKVVDENSATLAQAAASGAFFSSATIIATSDNGATIVYQMSNVMIASYRGGGNNDNGETLDLNCSKVSASFTPGGPSTSSSSAGSSDYDTGAGVGG
jgi:type VI protein secretion system component Hcp